jgi:PKD repeat protein
MERYFSKILMGMLGVTLLFTSCGKDTVLKSTVTDGAKPTSAFTYAAAPANALAITFTGTGANVQSSYWQFGDGSTSTDASPVHTYATAAKYTVTLRTVSTAGYAATSTQTITAIPAAAASFAVASQFELGVTFNNTSVSVASVVWDFGDGSATSTVTSPQHRYTAAGNYNVKLTVTGLLGDVNSSTQSISVQNTNLLKGGGFETGTNTFWKQYSGMTDIIPVYGYTGDGPAGGYDACLRFPSFTGGAGLNGLIYQGVNVIAGKQYKLSALVKLTAGGKNDYLQLYISTDPTSWLENATPQANFFLALNNYHAWGTTSSSTITINGDLYTATLTNGQYGVGVVTKGIYTAPITGMVYIGIQAGLYAGTSNGDMLVDNVNFVQVN